MEDEIEMAVKSLIYKASETKDGGDALKFSQSALNLAHVLHVHASTLVLA